MSIFFKKKYINKVEMASERIETKQTNLYFTRKDMGPVHKNFDNN